MAGLGLGRGRLRGPCPDKLLAVAQRASHLVLLPLTLDDVAARLSAVGSGTKKVRGLGLALGADGYVNMQTTGLGHKPS